MPISTDRLKHQAKKSTTNSVLNRKLVHSSNTAKIPFIKHSVVPAGTYVARVTAVKEAKTTAGEDAIDIIYNLTNANGKVVAAKERFPIDGYVLTKLTTHWFNNSLLPDDATYADIVGIEETVDISFVNPSSLGSLKNRRPVNHASKATSPKKTSAPPVNDADEGDLEEDMEEDLDDEFDDFLDETDDI